MKKLLLAALFAIACGSLVLAQAARSPEVRFKAAQHTEQVQGDLKAAIEQYKQVVAAGNRSLAAQALVRMAECYQKLGGAEAQKIYQQILREYGDQTEATALARARLADPKSSGTGITARQLWTNGVQTSIASDGRTVTAADFAQGQFEVRALTTGRATPRRVTTFPAYAEWPVLSPDLKQLAYAYAGPDTKFGYQLRIEPAQPGGTARPIGNRLFPYMYVNGWTRDSKALLVTVFEEGPIIRIAWMSTSDGTIRPLKSLEWQDPGRVALSPDGKFMAYALMVEQGTADREIRVLASDASGESVVVRAPGTNSSPVWSRDGSKLIYVSDRSGALGIWSIAIRDGRADGAPTRLKADVGDISLLGFSESGSLLYEQTIGSRDVFAIDLDADVGRLSGEAARLLDRFQGSNWQPASSPDGKSIAYLSRRTGTPKDWAHVVIRSLETGAEQIVPTLFRAGGGAGIPVWYPDGQALVEPTRNSQGHTVLYKIDLRTGNVSLLVDTGGSFPNAAAVAPDGRTIYSMAEYSGRVGVAAYDLASGRRTDILHSGNAKSIVASPDGRSIAFVTNEIAPLRNHIYVADADGRNAHPILTSDKREDAPSLLAGGLTWSPDSRLLYFIRGRLGALWRVPATGGAPAFVGDLTKSPVRAIDIPRDGRRVIFATDQRSDTVEVWALDNIVSKTATASR